MNCRFCSTPVNELFVSLGKSPLANSYPDIHALDQSEPVYPLDVFFCRRCFLAQLDRYEDPEAIFSHYAYFSSYSDAWLKHCQGYTERMTTALALGPNQLVIEVASNDGYMLQYFKRLGIPVLGIEPATNVAAEAVARGIPTETVFFGVAEAKRLTKEGRAADLLIANNVLAHVPDLNDFVEGLKLILKPKGTLTVEFPHLLSLVENTQFDTIYHEHFSYFSLTAARSVFSAHGLDVVDLVELATHGGSLRLHVKHTEARCEISENVRLFLEREKAARLFEAETHEAFRRRVGAVRQALRSFLDARKKEGKRVVAYGAPAKGNTLLNYCEIGSDRIEFTVDRNVCKQGRFLPGSHIPIEKPEKIRESRPDYVLILPWNLKDEIRRQMRFIEDWGGRFVVPIPEVRVLE